MSDKEDLAEIVYRVNNPHHGDYGTHEQTAKAILAAGWRPVGDPVPEQTYRISVDIPLDLPDEQREALLDAISDAVHDWEPKDREGWDADVSGYDHTHSVETAFDRELARNETALAIARRIRVMPVSPQERFNADRIITALEGHHA